MCVEVLVVCAIAAMGVWHSALQRVCLSNRSRHFRLRPPQQDSCKDMHVIPYHKLIVMNGVCVCVCALDDYACKFAGSYRVGDDGQVLLQYFA